MTVSKKRPGENRKPWERLHLRPSSQRKIDVADERATIDFEEFCGMMLASIRAAVAPKWLAARCVVEEEEDTLLLRYEPGEPGSLGRPLTLDHQLFVIDMQRRNTRVTSLSLHGNGIGPWAASELAHAWKAADASSQSRSVRSSPPLGSALVGSTR